MRVQCVIVMVGLFWMPTAVVCFQISTGRGREGGGRLGKATSTNSRLFSVASTRSIDLPTKEKTAHSDIPKCISDLDLPQGLQEALLRLSSMTDDDGYENDSSKIHKRIWVVDNSGSMNLHDGHALLSSSSECCTRWQELQETVQCHAQLASALNLPTDIRFLNQPSSKSIPRQFPIRSTSPVRQERSWWPGSRRSSRQQHRRATRYLQNHPRPHGGTALTDALYQVAQDVRKLQPQLEAANERVVLVLATDGCPHDFQSIKSAQEASSSQQQQQEQQLAQLQEALQNLQDLPVQVVVRLCTDYTPVVDFYNAMDQELDNLDVVDDYHAEAAQVQQHNPWLNYALILHRVREMGGVDDNRVNGILDALDERALTRAEIRVLAAWLLGPHVVVDVGGQGHDDNPKDDDDDDTWVSFGMQVHHLQQNERRPVHPALGAPAPWLDVDQLLAM